MPLVRVDLRRGKSAAHKKAIADGIYRALRQTFTVPEEDRFIVITEHDDVDRVTGALLVAQERLPRTLRIDLDRLRCKLTLYIRCLTAGQAQRCEQPQRNRLSVRQVEVGGRFEGMRERVPEVEEATGAVIVRILQADRGLEGCRAANIQVVAGEQLLKGAALNAVQIAERLVA